MKSFRATVIKVHGICSTIELSYVNLPVFLSLVQLVQASAAKEQASVEYGKSDLHRIIVCWVCKMSNPISI